MTTNVVFTARWKSQQPGAGGVERRRLALLIDAENQARTTRVPELIRRLEAQGFDPVIRRAFADWSDPSPRRWRKRWQSLGFWCIECPPTADGKNCTDARLIETTLDLGDYDVVDAVCIVSADADFLPAVGYLKRLGLVTVVAWTRGTQISEQLRQEADRVIEIEPDIPLELPEIPSGSRAMTAGETRWERLFEAAIANGLHARYEDGGWVDLGLLGTKARELVPGFDQRDHGHEKLVDLARTRPDLFELEARPAPNNAFNYWIRRNVSDTSVIKPIILANRREAAADG